MTGTATRRRLKVLLPVLGTLVVLAPLGYLWQASLVPKQFSVLDMGRPDYGTGPAGSHGAGAGHGSGAAGAVSVETLTADPTRKPDVVVDLVADAATLDVGGRAVAGFTLNGRSPGPTINATVGQLVEVRLRNGSVPEGVALHWHGLDVPNAMDGVAGVTQDAVRVGGDFTYRFVAEQVGTYWYHSHQVSHEQVVGGLLGALVVQPRRALGPDQGVDVVAVAHTYGGVKTLNGQPGDLRVPAKPGQTRAGPSGQHRQRAHLGLAGRRVPAAGHRRHRRPRAGPGAGLLGHADRRRPRRHGADHAGRREAAAGAGVQGHRGRPRGRRPAGAAPARRGAEPPGVRDARARGLGLRPGPAPTGPSTTRSAAGPGSSAAGPGLWWSINGRLFPDTPMYVVREGDVVRMHISDRSGSVHPMHLHGHHAVVLARNGVAATGSPWWVDSLNVRDGETYDIAFVADNPGVWMDHCHNLEHATDGMVAHLMYEGVTTPYTIGRDTPNHPE